MVDRIECFGRIKKKKKVSEAAGNGRVEDVVDVGGVRGPVLAPHKPLLGGIEQLGRSRHDGVGDGGSEDAVVGVGDGDGASVGDKVCGFLRKEEEESVVESRWGHFTLKQKLKDRE
jgi:hypothetical protein